MHYLFNNSSIKVSKEFLTKNFNDLYIYPFNKIK